MCRDETSSLSFEPGSWWGQTPPFQPHSCHSRPTVFNTHPKPKTVFTLTLSCLWGPLHRWGNQNELPGGSKEVMEIVGNSRS